MSAKYEVTAVKEKYFPPPCQEITDVKYKLQTSEYINSTTLGVAIFYPSLMKQISQTQYVDAHTLIGNIGGYIGLFLGIIWKISFMEIIDINLAIEVYLASCVYIDKVLLCFIKAKYIQQRKTQPYL